MKKHLFGGSKGTKGKITLGGNRKKKKKKQKCHFARLGGKMIQL